MVSVGRLVKEIQSELQIPKIPDETIIIRGTELLFLYG